MSIIIGFVTQNCAIVASDGRICSGAYFDNGVLTRKSHVDSDEFDKTFTLKQGAIIGAMAGTMKFQGKPIAKHFKEIIQDYCVEDNYSFDNLSDCICDWLRKKMQEISESEISFNFRNIDLILIGGKAELKMNTIRFKANPDSKLIEIEKKVIIPEKKNHVYWQLYGDDSSQAAIRKNLNDELSKKKCFNETNLRSYSYKAIRLGIKNSEMSNSGDHLNCGGRVYIKSIRHTISNSTFTIAGK